MNRHEGLAARFEAHRDHLRGVAYRMLGSLDEADDAVQLAWLRADRANLGRIENLAGWLTTVVARVCLDLLRVRRRRAEEPLTPAADTAAGRRGGTDPEQEAVVAESVGRALLVVLDRLNALPSSSTTCSPCPSARSRRSWGVHRWRARSSPVAPGTGFAARRPSARSISPSTTPWSRRSWPPHAAVI